MNIDNYNALENLLVDWSLTWQSSTILKFHKEKKIFPQDPYYRENYEYFWGKISDFGHGDISFEELQDIFREKTDINVNLLDGFKDRPEKMYDIYSGKGRFWQKLTDEVNKLTGSNFSSKKLQKILSYEFTYHHRRGKVVKPSFRIMHLAYKADLRFFGLNEDQKENYIKVFEFLGMNDMTSSIEDLLWMKKYYLDQSKAVTEEEKATFRQFGWDNMIADDAS